MTKSNRPSLNSIPINSRHVQWYEPIPTEADPFGGRKMTAELEWWACAGCRSRGRFFMDLGPPEKCPTCGAKWTGSLNR